ncbi:AAA family ATPase [Kitasatospora viridis]|uniref:WD40 repeat protein n=1 Tax=Kitasatospora viridis TaxID=281105 RepID=A0A561UCQ2_9ACTN|nr:trypsin-like peptidase domain-containing protein [Kitasatospora viridis]TWF97129.1 WD40 repeat protein [Kitasatospora viridis]
MTAAFLEALRPEMDGWVAAVHRAEHDRSPIGSGFLIDADRVLTCAHVVFSGGQPLDDLWVAFPKADELMYRRVKVRQVSAPPPNVQDEQDVAVLVLDQAVPEDFAARLRIPKGGDLVGGQWWSFGFPDGMLGNSSGGTVGEALGYGWVRLDTESRYSVGPGYSGGALWSADYQAVVGIVGQAQGSRGDARALTLRAIDQYLPDEKLSLLTDWSAEAAGDAALSAWGWTLADDPESGRHWRPRARGVSTEAEQGFRFRGRAAALDVIVAWITGRRGDRRQVLLVTGSPGVGKSAVLGRIVTTADRGIAASLPPEDDAVRAPEGSVACAVHARGKTALDVAGEIAAAASAALPERVDDLPTVLRDALKERSHGSFAIVIDALDEASTPEQARVIMRSVAIPMAETCADLGVRVVVGSRRTDDAGDLLAPFRTAVETVDLDSEEFFAPEDLVAYTLATLQLLGDERADSPYTEVSTAVAVAERIAVMAGGNFLIAGLVARTHGMHDRAPAAPEELSFTSTVDAALREYLVLLSSVDGIPAVDVLTALAYAESPGLTVALWRTAVQAVTGHAPDSEALTAFARSSAANFLIESSDDTTRAGSFRLFHQALNDSLIGGRAASRADTTDEHAITRAFMSLGRAGGWENIPAYLLRALPRHAVRSGVIDDLLADDLYPLHADLRRLIPAAKASSSALAQARGRLLRRTPHALDAAPADRVALFSVTETREHLGSTYRQSGLEAPYRAAWAVGTPHAEEIVLEGHTDTVNTICAIPVGDTVLLATAGNDNTVRLWDPATGGALRILTGHTAAVLTLCVVATGGRVLLATAGSDGTVRLWDPETGSALRVLEGHTGAVRAACSVPDGDRALLATDGADRTVRLWDPETGALLRTFEGGTDLVGTVSVVPVDGRMLLATNGNDNTVRLWDCQTGGTLRTLEGHTGWVRAVCVVSVVGRTLLASAGNDHTVRLWDPESGALVRTLEGHTDWVNTVCVVSVVGRTLLASAGNDHTVRLWDPESGALVRTLEGHTDWVNTACAVWMDGHQLLATAGADNTVRLWDPEIDGSSSALEGNSGAVLALCAISAREDTLLATAGADHMVRLWDVETGGVLLTFEGHTDWVRAVCVVPTEGRRVVATAGDDGTVRLWEPETGEMLHELQGQINGTNALCVVPSGDQILLATAGDDHLVQLWDPETGTMLRTIDVPRKHDGERRLNWVNSVCLVPVDGRNLVATAGDDETVCLWDPETGEMLRAFEGHGSWVNSVCVVPVDGRNLVATAGEDRTVRLWDPETGEMLRAFRDHTGPVRAVCPIVLGDRTLLASAGKDNTVRLWDARSPHSVLVIPVRSPAFSVIQAKGLLLVGLSDGLLALNVSSPPSRVPTPAAARGSAGPARTGLGSDPEAGRIRES